MRRGIIMQSKVSVVAVALVLAGTGAAFAMHPETVDPQVISGNYLEQNGVNQCSSDSDGSSGASSGGDNGSATKCSITFSALPAGRVFSLEHVSCKLYALRPLAELYVT